MSDKLRFKKTFISLLMISVLIATGFFLYKNFNKPDTVYRVTQPFYADIVKKVIAAGSINPREEVEVKSRVSGVVDKLHVEAGGQVKLGQLIARIQIIPNVVSLNNAESELRSAEINYENTKDEFKRQKALYKKDLISETSYKQQELQYQLNEQRLNAARSNLELIKEGASKKSGTESNLVYSTIEGMVLDVPVKAGGSVIESNTFNDGTTIAIIANIKDLVFEGSIDESDVEKLEVGMPIAIKIGALQDKSYPGTLEFIAPKATQEAGADAVTFKIRADIKLKKDDFLRAGYSANADITLHERKQVLAVREKDLVFEKGKVMVEIEVSEQKFERREIKIGLSDGINIEVLEGLTESDNIKAQEQATRPRQGRGR